MKLYEDDIAPNCRRVRLLLAEKGVEMAGEKVSVLEGDNLSEAYRAINPHGLVPSLELDDGSYLWESTAICRFLEAQYPEPCLMGADALETAKIEMWDRHTEFEGMAAVAEYFRNTVPPFAGRALPGHDDIAQIPALVERGKARAEAFFRQLDQPLVTSEFLAGERFTYADITTMCVTDFALFTGLELPADCANLQRWFETVSARPSAKAWPGMVARAAGG